MARQMLMLILIFSALYLLYDNTNGNKYIDNMIRKIFPTTDIGQSIDNAIKSGNFPLGKA